MLPIFSVEGKTAIITGSTKGIGYGIARVLALAGANVVINGRCQKECDNAANEIRRSGNVAIGFKADITNKDQVIELVEQVKNEFGKIDILVNNAGTAINRKAEDITEMDYDQVININQRAVFFVTQAVGKEMIKEGSGKIINIASVYGLVGDKQVATYCISKGAVIQMTRALALEWAKHNIQINALCPGYVQTPMNREILQDEKLSNAILKKIPMRRFGQVEDIEGAVIYLASNASNYMTGQCVVVDGGWTAQ